MVLICFDGTTFDDLGKYRPGLKAKDELGIISPLALTEISKDELREMCRAFNLDFAELPSFSCFATRFPYDEIISLPRLKAVALAEQLLKQVGFRQVRVRVHQNIARLEIYKEDFPEIITNQKIIKELKNLGFDYITLDLEGFRSGSMDIPIKSSGSKRK